MERARTVRCIVILIGRCAAKYRACAAGCRKTEKAQAACNDLEKLIDAGLDRAARAA